VIVPVFKTGGRQVCLSPVGSTPTRFRHPLPPERSFDCAQDFGSRLPAIDGLRDSVYDSLAVVPFLPPCNRSKSYRWPVVVL
jgi:hypothetical protein